MDSFTAILEHHMPAAAAAVEDAPHGYVRASGADTCAARLIGWQRRSRVEIGMYYTIQV